MKKLITFFAGAFLSIANVFAQTPPPLYIHFVSHNEPGDNLNTPINYANAKTNVLQMAALVKANDMRWNLQTSDGFVHGALTDQANTSSNIFATLASPTYSNWIEIDPRSKNSIPVLGVSKNIADQWYLLDSLGANPTHTLGGYVWTSCSAPNNTATPDWIPYIDTIVGNVYGNKWQCSLLSGAGSQNHCNDLNDFGVFKPGQTNFYTHSPGEKLWCMGTGCAPLLVDSVNEQDIIDMIQGQVDSIQNGLWPSDKFYVTRIMTNQRDFNTVFFQKLTTIMDSLKLIPASQLKWTTLEETFTAFEAWQISSGLDYSQWRCGDTYTVGVDENTTKDLYSIYPNPFNNTLTIEVSDLQKHTLEIVDFLGRVVCNNTVRSKLLLDLSGLSNGIYMLRVDGGSAEKIIKN